MPQPNEKANSPIQDFFEARAFLQRLDPEATAFCFQCFDDNKERRKAGQHEARQRGVKYHDPLARTLHGSLSGEWLKFISLQEKGAGVFVTVNRTDGKARTAISILAVRAVWGEFDDGWPDALPIEPSVIVESSPGKFHAYWLVDGLTAQEHAAVMARLVHSYGSDPGAADLARVLRLPGLLHLKDPATPFLVRIEQESDRRYTRDEILKAFPPVDAASGREPGDHTTKRYDATPAEVRQALAYVLPDERFTWFTVGAALKLQFGESGRDLWDEWAKRCEDKFDLADSDRVWESIQRKPGEGKLVTVGSILKHAWKNGWKGPKTNADDEFEPIGDIGATGSLLERSRDIRREDLARARAGALIKGLLHPGDAAVMYGESRGGKTFVALFIAHCIALGRVLLGRKVKRAPVLYISLEGVRGFRERMHAATEVYGDPGDWFARLVVPVLLSKGDEGAKGMATVIEAAKQLAKDCGQPVGLIIVDTYARATAGDDENSTADAMAYAEKRAAEISRQTGAAVMTIMHTNRAGDLRGSLHSRNAADLIIRIERSGEGEETSRKAIGEKVKDGHEAPLFDFTLRGVPLGRDDDGDAFGSAVIEATPPKAGANDTDKQKIVRQAYAIVAERLGRDDVPADDVRAEFDKINEPDIARKAEKVLFKDDHAKERYITKAKSNAWHDAKKRLPQGLQVVEREGVKVMCKVAAKAPRGKTNADDEFEPIPPDLLNG